MIGDFWLVGRDWTISSRLGSEDQRLTLIMIVVINGFKIILFLTDNRNVNNLTLELMIM